MVAVLLASASPTCGLAVQWTAIASDPAFLLEFPNADNPDGIEHSWDGESLHDAGQRSLSSFRAEAAFTGRMGGGINWDDLADGTVVADSDGIELTVVGLPGDFRVTATTDEDTMEVEDWVWNQDPDDAGPVSGSKLVEALRDPDQVLTLEFQSSDGLELHGFGFTVVNSGWEAGAATFSYYSGSMLLGQFGPSDGIRFHDHSVDDNFIGYWSSQPVTKVRIQTDDMVLLGRFDDLGMILVPEPAALTLLALGGLAVIRRVR